jgi:hypothetical protein
MENRGEEAEEDEKSKDEGISNEGNIVAIYYTTCTQ